VDPHGFEGYLKMVVEIRNLVAPPTNNTYVPFGASPRMCPGIKLVKMKTSAMIHLLPGIIIIALLLVNESVNAKNPTNPSDFSINSGRRRYMSDISHINILADLVASKPCFHIEAVVHRFMGRQTHICFLVMEQTGQVVKVMEYQIRHQVGYLWGKNEEVSFVDGVLEGALGALGDEFGSLGDGVFVSSWVKSTNNVWWNDVDFWSLGDLGNRSSSGGHECVLLLMMSEGDGELVLCI
ncbi:hypothetical protein Tco_1200762, partial [Tanacetum coccineum]